MKRHGRQPIALALGNFDGVHCGHQAILRDLVQKCRVHGWRPAVYTFDPHPAKILAPRTAPPLIQTPEQKRRALEAAGVAKVIVEKFDKKFSQMNPERFFETVLVKRLRVRGIWVGHDFTFGHKRSGHAEMLAALCKKKGIGFRVIRPHFEGETLVSSTQIRALVRGGQVDLAAKLLGRPFALTGKVVKGMGLGGKLGIHTANLKVENELLPKTGLYITTTGLRTTDYGLRTKKNWPSVTSVGFNPTFPGKGFSVETHLIGFNGNLRGKKIEVAFLKWLRDELVFPNEETLAAQIQNDIDEAVSFHKAVRADRPAV
ncbi:MAG: bifunctional riboflavin kinase/FAD synthetase, partial [Deltaproteobacteria bacterium]|nr:bifunctional riboflavin kinase/FAD synthetase [Deltaproteobacteria bacterium]